MRAKAMFVAAALVTGGLTNPESLGADSGSTVAKLLSFGGNYSDLASPAIVLNTSFPPKSPPIASNSTQTAQVAGVGGVPEAGVGSVLVQIVVTAPSQATDVTLYASEESRPSSPTLSLPKRGSGTRLSVIALGGNGAIDVHNRAGTVHVKILVVGWFPRDSGFHPVMSHRVADTETGLGVPAGRILPDATVSFNVVSVAGEPSGLPGDGNVTAIAMSVTAANPTASSHLTFFATGGPRPGLSSMLTPSRATTSAMVVAPVSADGYVSLHNSVGTTHVKVDVLGWWGSKEFVAMTPTRIVDSNTGLGIPRAVLAANKTVSFTAAGIHQIPADAAAVALVVRGVKGSKNPELTMFPSGQIRPVTGLLTSPTLATVGFTLWVKPGNDGKISIFNKVGSTHFTVDVVGYLNVVGSGDVSFSLSEGVFDLLPEDVSIAPGSSSDSGGSFQIQTNGDLPSTGDLFHLPPTNDLKQGLIGRITRAVDNGDGTILMEFGPANPDEVFAELDISFSGTPDFSTDDPETQIYGQVGSRVDSLAHQSCEGESAFEVAPYIEATFDSADIDFSLRDKRVRVLFEGQASAGISAIISASVACTKSFPTRYFAIPYVLFELKPEIKLELIGEFSFSASVSVPVSVGFERSNGGLTNLSTATVEADGSLDTSTDFSITVTPAAELDAKLLGIGGAEFSIGLPVIGTLSPLDSPCITLSTQISAELELELGRWGFEWELELGEFTTVEFIILQQDTGCPEPEWSGTLTLKTIVPMFETQFSIYGYDHNRMTVSANVDITALIRPSGGLTSATEVRQADGQFTQVYWLDGYEDSPLVWDCRYSSPVEVSTGFINALGLPLNPSVDLAAGKKVWMYFGHQPTASKGSCGGFMYNQVGLRWGSNGTYHCVAPFQALPNGTCVLELEVSPDGNSISSNGVITGEFCFTPFSTRIGRCAGESATKTEEFTVNLTRGTP